jgi:alkylhydroperoxidase family enzyme
MEAGIPRLELEQMTPQLQQALQPRVRRLGYLGEWFKCAAHAPDVLLAFMRFTDELKEALPDRVSEVAILTIATALDNAYERNQHERLAVRTGYGRDWVAAVERLEPDAAALSPLERAVQRFALAVVRTGGRDTRAEFGALHQHLSPAETIALLMLVGRYVTHSIGVQALGLQPPVPSIFEAPTLVTACTALPPEGTFASRGGPSTLNEDGFNDQGARA